MVCFFQVCNGSQIDIDFTIHDKQPPAFNIERIEITFL